MILPDVNVWLALSVSGHVHHRAAKAWHGQLESGTRLFFCRLTQLGFLRLLSLDEVMGRGEALSQVGAWRIYDQWWDDAAVGFLAEPDGLDPQLRRRTSQSRPASRAWTDAYLCAFAEVAGLRLATLDRPLSRICPVGVLVG